MSRPHIAGAKSPMHEPVNDTRRALISEWLSDLGLSVQRLTPASSDASFRRYFRATFPGGSYIVMDAPPDREDVRPYLKVGELLASLGVHVPRVHAADSARGLLLLEDLGSTSYLQRLEAGDDPDRLYADALQALAEIQTRGAAAAAQLAPYDEAALGRELALMPEWFCGRHLGLTLGAHEAELVRRTFDWLIAQALEQPAVLVHRDYHSRNLMVLSERNPGIIDFQDAVRGPIGYDLVSLLKDCYISWPRARVEGWVSGYHGLLRRRGLACGSERELLRWFDIVGVQRHLKVLGIFCRLWYRDGKPGYLADLPLTLQYVCDACRSYPELGEFGAWLERSAAQLSRANAQALERSRGAAGA
jgi:N-acetylmuramate 1-kinase